MEARVHMRTQGVRCSRIVEYTHPMRDMIVGDLVLPLESGCPIDCPTPAEAEPTVRDAADVVVEEACLSNVATPDTQSAMEFTGRVYGGRHGRFSMSE